MSSHWSALRAQFEAAIRRHDFLIAFRELQSRTPGVAQHRDPIALIDRLQDRSGDFDDKNKILAALVTASQHGEAASMPLLYLGLWPGLDAARGRLRRIFEGMQDELVAEIASEFLAQVRKLRLNRVRRIAATLVRNVERDVRRRRIAQLGKAFATEPFDEERHFTSVGQGALSFFVDVQDEDGLRRLEERVALLIGDDAALVIDIAVRGAAQREAARARALSHDAGRKRYQRALAKLSMALAA